MKSKKVCKILCLMFAIVLTFTMFTGFTFAEDKTLNSPRLNSVVLDPNEETTINVATGETLSVGFAYGGAITSVKFNNVVHTSWEQSDYAGATAVVLSNLPAGTHKVAITNPNTEYSILLVVDNDTTLPPVLSSATVKFYSSTGAKSQVISTYESNFDTQLTNMPNAPRQEGYRFVTWAYWNNTISSWVNFDDTSLPMVTSNMLMNGIFKVGAVMEKVEKVELKYFLEEDGFMWTKKWVEFDSKTVNEGDLIPDMTHKFGVAFEKMTFDEKGNIAITANTKADSTRTNVYVHLNEIEGVQVKYMSGVYSAFDSELLYGVYEYDYVTSGDNFKTKQAPALEVKSLTDSITYDFMFWSTDIAGKNRIEADAIITEDITVYAQYDQLQADTGFKLFVATIHDFFQWVDNIAGINNLWITYSIFVGLIILVVAILKKLF